VKVHTSAVTGISYKLLLQVISTDNLLFGSPFTPDEIIPDGSGDAWFNISGIVDQYFEKSFQFPLVNKETVYSDLAYDIHLKCGETYLDALTLVRTTTWNETEGPYFIIKGKLKPYELAQLNSLSSSFHAKYIAGGKWFSKLPLIQYVAPWQPVKLWWCPPSTQSSVNFNVKGYYSDGSTDTKTATPGLYADILYEFDCQPALHALALEPTGKRLSYYEVTLTGAATVEKRTFILDWNYYENNYFLFVDNQIGGVECLWLHGAVKYAPEGDATVTTRPMTMGAGVKTPSLIASGNETHDKWTINSGYHQRDEMKAWAMLLGKPQAWLAVPPEGGSTDLATYSIIPVIIENKPLSFSTIIYFKLVLTMSQYGFYFRGYQ
jgi:hypothetical protein